MTNRTLLYIAAIASAIADTTNKFIGGTPEATGDTNAAPETPTAQTTSRRGRPPKENPATPPTEENPTTPPAEEPVKGAKTEEELREVIKPLVEDGRGEEVKKLIAKHGGTKLADLPAKNHAAFVRDIEALAM